MPVPITKWMLPLTFAAALAMPSATSLAQPSTTVETQSVESATLDNFADATRQLHEIERQMLPLLSEAQTEEQQLAVHRRMHEEMVSVLQDHDLTIEEYNAIAVSARDDAELQERIIRRLREQ